MWTSAHAVLSCVPYNSLSALKMYTVCSALAFHHSWGRVCLLRVRLVSYRYFSFLLMGRVCLALFLHVSARLVLWERRRRPALCLRHYCTAAIRFTPKRECKWSYHDVYLPYMHLCISERQQESRHTSLTAYFADSEMYFRHIKETHLKSISVSGVPCNENS